MKSLIEALERRALLTGELDTTFGTGGITTTDFDVYTERFTRVASVGNRTYAVGSVGGASLLARFDAAGKLDTTFNGTGYVTSSFSTAGGASGVAIGDDGTIYVGGTRYLSPGVNDIVVAAYTPGGQLDTRFDGDGYWNGSWTGFNTNRFAGLAAVDGYIYAAGSDSHYLTMCRFTPTGVDTTFNHGLSVAVYSPPVPVDAQAFVYRPFDYRYGPFYIAARSPGGVQPDVVVARFKLDGSRDTAFSSAVLPQYGGNGLSLADMTADLNGRVYLGGSINGQAAVVALSSVGTIDTLWGAGGYFIDPTHSRALSLSATAAVSIAVVPPLVFASFAPTPATSTKSDVAVLMESGEPNRAFGNNGFLTINGYAVAMAAQDNGKTVIAGQVGLGNDRVDTFVGRLNPPSVPHELGGYLFDDVNGDGIRNDSGGATTFYGITAYLDTNNSGSYDTGEPTAYAGTGKFSFPNVAPGTYKVGLYVYPGVTARQTYPAANGLLTVTVSEIAAHTSVGPFGVSFTPPPPATYTVSGSAFIDQNKNGQLDAGEAEDNDLFSWYVYVDTNNNGGLDDGDTYGTTIGRTNRYTLTLPADGKTYRVQLRNENPQPFTTAAYYDVQSSVGGTELAGRDFGIAPVPAGASASGVVFDDANQNGKQDAGEAGLANVTTYIDIDNDKVLDTNEAWTVTDSAGRYSFSDLPNTGAATRLRAIVPNGGKQTTPVDGKGYGLTLTVGASNPGKLFGIYTPPVTPALGNLSGFVFDDTDRDGVYDANETKTGGKTVFLDGNNNGKLDSGEKSVTTGTGGAWSFGGLAAGTYHVRRVFASGYTQSNALIDVTLTAGQTVSGLSIGSKSGTVTPPVTNTASISGSVFNDNNKNGKYDSGDGYAKSVVVFLDTDNDGKLDSGETSVTTDSNGRFSFTKLVAGTYRVRRVMPSGYTYSTTKPDVTLISGQAKSGVLIGTKKA